MLRVPKRCRLLVSLLLLCGCLASFSSVSFATEAEIYYGTRVTKTYSDTVTVDVITNPMAAVIENVSVTPNDTKYAHTFNVETDTAFTVIISNSSNNYVNFSGNYIGLDTLTVNDSYGSGTYTLVAGQSVWSVKDVYGDTHGVTSSPTYRRLLARIDPEHLYNNRIILKPKETISFSFTVTVGTRFYSNSIIPLSFTGFDGYGQITNFEIKIGSTAVDILSDAAIDQFTTTGGDAMINSSIQDQIEQSEQQHQEQMEQSQQQYEDFTNDGNSPSSDGISGSDFVGGSRDEVNDKLGFFEIINYTIQGVLGIFNADAVLTDTTLTLPGFEIPIRSTDPNTGMVTSTTYTVWRDTEYDLGAELNTNFGDLMTVVRFATSVVVLFSLINYIIKVYHRILDIPRW